jgi:hypothetical protein
VVLAASAPLLQHWFGLSRQRPFPFRLYALSNVGSILALLSYPAIFETNLGRGAQVTCWRAGLGLFVITTACVGMKVWRANPVSRSAEASPPVSAPAWHSKLLWILLPACASLLLAAVTNKICQDLPPLALLWILPLTVYLLSFVLCFSGARFYQRRWFAPVLAASLVVMGLVLSGRLTTSPLVQIAIFVSGLFVCCVVCHGEVYDARPEAARLTSFYLGIAAGGVLGTLLVAIVAPRVLHDYYELHYGLIACGALFLAVCWFDRPSRLAKRFSLLWSGGVATLAIFAVLLLSGKQDRGEVPIYQARNFYGVIRVYRHEFDSVGKGLVELVHGQVCHGLQFIGPARAQEPTLYYTPASGVGKAFSMLGPGQARRIGVVGLGAGTLAAYARPSDRITFYEINPEVEKVARTCFTFLRACRGLVEVVPGDARLSLEHEASHGFDLLVLDAFNSDSIPIHLLTKEAFAIYHRQIATNGIIAVHISNMSLNLESVVCELAHKFGYAAQRVDQKTSDETAGILASTWILLQRAGTASKQDGHNGNCRGQLWTDDFNGLMTVLRWPGAKEASELPTILEFESIQSENQRARARAVMDRFRQAVARDPDSPLALNNLASLLATSSDPSTRDGEESVRLAEKACALTQYNNSSTLSTLAAAYGEAGRFNDAVAMSEKACALAASRGETNILAGNQLMLKSFRQKRPFHQMP